MITEIWYKLPTMSDPDLVLQHVAKERAIDLFVMEAYGHSPLRNMLVGSTTTQMIRSGQMSVLLFR